MNKWKWVFAFLLLAALGLGGWFLMNRAKKTDRTVIQLIHPRIGRIARSITATAVIQPQNRLEMKPPVAGRVEQVLVREGDEVRSGDTVALMSSTERAALLDAAKAKDAEAQEYWENIYKPIPLIAPIDGTVIVSTMQPGQSITQADPVVVLSNRLIVQAQVDETDIGRVQTGQQALILLDAYPDIRVRGTVDHIYHESTVVNNVTIYRVDVLPEEVPAVFRSGMSANVEIVEASRENALLVPAEAVRRDEDGEYVRVAAGERDKSTRRAIATGLSDGTRVEVTKGLSADDTLLLESRPYALPKNEGGNNPFAPQRRRRPSNSGPGGGSSGR